MMNAKKMLMLLFALLCVLTCALAEDVPTEETVIAAMTAGEADGWRIPEVSAYEPGEYLLRVDGTPYLAMNTTSASALVVMQKDGRNVLCLLERDARDQWRLRAQNANMLYQGADAPIPYIYCEIEDQFELNFHHMEDGEQLLEYYHLVRGLDGWRVTHYSDERTGATDVSVGKKLLTFTDDYYQPSYTVRTEFEYRFERFDLEAFRRAAERAGSLLPDDADTPREGYWLPDQVEGEFVKNQKFDVYTAPGVDSYRAANGRAAVSTNGGVEIFGETQGWLMVQYEVNRDQRRIGYITADALPFDTPVRALRFAYQPARMLESAVLTDDPFWSRGQLKKLAEGEEVTLLAGIGDWYYVEAVMPDGRNVRGFVPASAVTVNLANG